MTPRRINPDDIHHAKLEQEVIDHLTATGFIVESNTYHDRLTPDFVKRAARMVNLTSLIVRTQADRVALHRDADFAFYLECKTISGPHANLAVEALPLAVHREKAKLGSRCLYVVRDVVPDREFEGSFWADKDIPMDALFVPKRFSNTELERRLIVGFPNLPVRHLDSVAGSGDPFVRVKREDFNKFMFPDWRTAILCEVAKVCNPRVVPL